MKQIRPCKNVYSIQEIVTASLGQTPRHAGGNWPDPKSNRHWLKIYADSFLS